MVEIMQLEKEAYAGKKFTARYRTGGYYDICACESGFRVNHIPLEAPVAYGAFENEELIGFAEGSQESWNNRFRISNLCVFDETKRGMGVGTALMEAIQKAAVTSGARMIVLETQSCNETAIAFYRKNGFSVIGFDLYAYSNTDPEQHEVRLEMGKPL